MAGPHLHGWGPPVPATKSGVGFYPRDWDAEEEEGSLGGNEVQGLNDLLESCRDLPTLGWRARGSAGTQG